MDHTHFNQVSQKDEQLIRLMQLLGDRTRFQIFKMIVDNDNLCVSEIAKQMNMSASAISQHFKQLENARMVTKVRYGQRICYQVEPSTIATELLALSK